MATPFSVYTDQEVEDILSIPQPETVELMKRLDGDIMILGIGGKMGPTLGRIISRAIEKAGVSKTLYGVSRFSDESKKKRMEDWGITCISCDLLDEEDIAKLPKVKNVIYMAGRKFGMKGSDYVYWAMNTLAPAYVCKHFKDSDIIVFSSGNVYSFWPADSEGPTEEDPTTPNGEYSNSCVGRERIFEYFSRVNGTRMLQFRLNYAIDLRYGVLYDIAEHVRQGELIDLAMGYANVIWQADANNIAVRCLEHVEAPASVLNVTGPKFSIRDAAQRFGKIMGKEPVFTGEESSSALLSDRSKMKGIFGDPPVTLDQMIEYTADWIMNGGVALNKPTHFERRDGEYLD